MSLKDSFMRMAVPELLSRHKQELLNLQIDPGQLPKPINEIDDNTIRVGSDFTVIRNWGCTFAFVFALFLGGGHVLEIHAEWKGSEKSTLDFIEFRKEKYGDDYFETTSNKVARKIYDELGDDLKLNFDEYLEKIRYIDDRRGGNQIGRDIFAFCFVLTILIVSTFLFIRFKRLAPLYFDREKQLVYTWRGGLALAQRYEDLQYLYHVQFLQIPLGVRPTRRRWGQKKLSDVEVGWVPYRIMPTGPYFNSFKDYEQVLAYVVQFMENGRESVMPEKAHWKRKVRDFLFYEDQKPEDFDEQLEDVLRRLECNRPAWLKDVERHQEKGWSK